MSEQFTPHFENEIKSTELGPDRERLSNKFKKEITSSAIEIVLDETEK